MNIAVEESIYIILLGSWQQKLVVGNFVRSGLLYLVEFFEIFESHGQKITENMWNPSICCWLFSSAFSLSPVPGPERNIGGLQGTGTSSVLRTSRAQRAAGRQMHQNVAAEAFPTAARPSLPRLARDRIQLGRTGGRPRGPADEQHHSENNWYAKTAWAP